MNGSRTAPAAPRASHVIAAYATCPYADPITVPTTSQEEM